MYQGQKRNRKRKEEKRTISPTPAVPTPALIGLDGGGDAVARGDRGDRVPVGTTAGRHRGARAGRLRYGVQYRLNHAPRILTSSTFRPTLTLCLSSGQVIPRSMIAPFHVPCPPSPSFSVPDAPERVRPRTLPGRTKMRLLGTLPNDPHVNDPVLVATASCRSHLT